jgi:fatty acid desaturase
METTGSRYERQALQRYARELRPHLPPAVLRPEPGRLWWLPLHLAIVGACAAVVVDGAPWYVAAVAAVVAGHSWGCLGFLAHEVLHHAVVRDRRIERAVGWIGFLPYGLSPSLWSVWHNQAHHGNTGKPIADPDGYGTLGFWRKNRVVRVLETLAPGSGRPQSALFLFVWFSIHSLLVLVFHSRRNDYYARVSRRAVYAETASMLAFWLVVLAAVGPYAFLFVWLVPTLAANAVVMSYIATNHFLNPLTEVNDPLANSLSVTAPRWLETLHLQFGYHVEHHLFPTMSARHAPTVRDVLVRRYGDRYLTMPHTRALRLLYARPKLHATHDTLVDPRTLATFNTLAPGDQAMARVA